MVLSETTCWEAGPGAAGWMHRVSSIGSYENNFTGAPPAEKAGQDQSLTDPRVHAGKIKFTWSLAGVKRGAQSFHLTQAHSASSRSEVRLQVRPEGGRASGSCLQSKQAHDGILEK